MRDRKRDTVVIFTPVRNLDGTPQRCAHCGAPRLIVTECLTPRAKYVSQIHRTGCRLLN
jgi:hypothetical protein